MAEALVSSSVCVPEETLNITNSSIVSYLLYDNADRIIITIINPIILFTGFLGNLSFLYVMLRIRRMRTITNIYLTNLAIADICFLTTAVGEKLGRYLVSPLAGDQSTLGKPGCLTIYTFMNTCYFASLYLITMVTLEKYYAICRPIEHRRIAGFKRAGQLVALGWFVSFCFACLLIPGYVQFSVVCISWPTPFDDVLPDVFGVCTALDDWVINYVNGLQSVPFFITLSINTFMYYNIIKAMTFRARVVPGKTRPNSSTIDGLNHERLKFRNQVTKMVLIIGVIFFICVTPYHSACLVLMISGSLDKHLLSVGQLETLLHVCRLLTYINSAVNPYVYNISNSLYRKCFKEAFLLTKFRHTENESRPVTSLSMVNNYVKESE
ncbi:somatostatin receptor type 2-like [Amphiura filiformis]|uniref:somatostatin receptor type 2-like n=1 Tax=Amphiura filiformis TaxID=82378 RepID=UPI003B221407